MKKHLSLLLCLVMLVSMFTVFAVESSAAASSSIVWDFSNPASIAAVQGNDLSKCTNLMIGANRTGLSSPSAALSGSVSYDADAKAVVLGAPAEQYKTTILRPYMITAGTSFKVKDYPFVKIRFKLETSLTKVVTQIRTTKWQSATLVSPTPVGEWVEKVVPLTGTGWYNGGATITPPSTSNNAYNPSWYLQFHQEGQYIDKDFKATVQYIGFFKTKAEADAYRHTSVPTTVEAKLDNPNAAWTMVSSSAYAPFYAGNPQAGNQNGLIHYDSVERSLYFTPEYSKKISANTNHVYRVNVYSKDATLSGNDYRFIKLRYKIVTDEFADKEITVRLRDQGYHQSDFLFAGAASPVNQWVEVIHDLSASKLWGNHTIAGPSSSLRIQFDFKDTSVNIYDEDDFRVYVQYVAFFTDKAAAEAHTYTVSDEYETATGKSVIIPMDMPKTSYVLSGNRYSSGMSMISHSFGADGKGTVAFDEAEKSIYITASEELDNPTQARYVFRGTHQFTGADYPYVKLCYKITNYTPAPNDWLSIRDNNWATYRLTDKALITDEWTTVTVKMDSLVDVNSAYACAGAWDKAVIGGTTGSASNDLRIQLWLNDGANYNITKSEDARFYLKYIAFFQTKAEADAFDFEAWRTPAEADTSLGADPWLAVLMRKYTEKFSITAMANEGGTISDIGTTEVKYKKNMSYTITAEEGYKLVDVLVDGESVGAVTEYTFKKVKEPHTIEAVFEAIEKAEEGK